MIAYKVVVRPSTLTRVIPSAGNGLFAYDPTKSEGQVVFKNLEVLFNYEGERIDAATILARYGSKSVYKFVRKYQYNRFETSNLERVVKERTSRVSGPSTSGDLAPYIFQIGSHFVDGINSNSSPARYINDCNIPRDIAETVQLPYVCNAKFRTNLARDIVEVVATRQILQDEEIFVQYSREGGYFK